MRVNEKVTALYTDGELRTMDHGPIVTVMRAVQPRGYDPYNSADAYGREWRNRRKRKGWRDA